MKTNKIILAICLSAFVGSVVAASPRSTSPVSDATQAELLRKGVIGVRLEDMVARENELAKLAAENAAIKAAAAKSYLTTARETAASVLRKPVCTVRGYEVTVGKLAAAGAATAGVVAVGKSGKLSGLKAKLPSLPTNLFARKK